MMRRVLGWIVGVASAALTVFDMNGYDMINSDGEIERHPDR